MSKSLFKNKTVLITAGPTREAIDPVRYISNHSSGKMGYAIAEAFLQQGAHVVLVSGPVNLQLQHPNLKLIPVITAFEMYLASHLHFQEIDIAVFAAAVADYKPAVVCDTKIKKAGDELYIKLVKNRDIAFEFGEVKQINQLSIGFALETNNEMEHAIGKLQHKNFDMVVLNSMNDAGATFEYDTNKVTILKKDKQVHSYTVKSKKEVADDILGEIRSVIMDKYFLSNLMQD